MSEQKRNRKHPQCSECCGDLFKCGDLITVRFITGNEDDVFDGIYISSTCNRLIWKNTDIENNPFECTSCSIISITERRANAVDNLITSNIEEESIGLDNLNAELDQTPPALPPPEPDIKPALPTQKPTLLQKIINFFIKR
ncbi:hypothetical protein [Haloplasma contractile]|uniref:Uncharacterized protein n=1 Tax=Haloplasma contractile SSD-17B TaxID=1033810 RepID=U2FLI9_9MOLU|nr:hypothetical protein [Haloplasma contractile]ERJ12039.1 hypothetical protein HLPCO_001953 [Haloplasma contractile SSD-17B]